MPTLVRKKQLITFFVVIFIGLALWLSPHPEEIPEEGWQLFAIFLATIIGIILKPFPMGTLCIFAMSVATLTRTLSLEEVLAGFHNPIVWLVVFAFFISRGFIKSGLGNRVAYYFVALFGKKTLGLSYSLLASEFLLSPAIPSVTARAGGIVFPVAKGLALSFGSDPQHKTERKIGSFLVFTAYQGSVITSAMFLTAMAANPFFVGLTQDAGYDLSWGTWALAALVPGLISLAVMPLIVYFLYPPSIKKTNNAALMAKEKLAAMGKLKQNEWLMLFIFLLLLILWIFGSAIPMSATVAALLGLALILVFRILDWQEVKEEAGAWDTFIWFASLIMLATSLNRLGFTPWMSQQAVHLIGGLNWPLAFTILALIYFYAHYFFASNTAHVGAMYPAFLLVALGLGTPPHLAILIFAFASCLAGGLTHYGSGPAPIYYGSGYIEIKDWWKVGFVISIVNICIWAGVGTLWWKAIGLI